MSALYHTVLLYDHIITQIVEPKLIVCSVSYIAAVHLLLFRFALPVCN